MNASAFIFLIGVFASSSICSCNKGNSRDTTKDSAVVELAMKNVVFGSDTAQKIDIYLPANRDTENTKLILFIHGGGWVGGDKNEFTDAVATLRTRLPDYAFFNMNYRLVNSQNKFPDQVNDINSVIGFIEKNAAGFRVNSNKIGLIGASAGAHLALLYAYKNNTAGKIKAVVDLFGPADLADLYKNHPIPQEARYLLKNLLGSTPATAPAIYNEASPIHFVNPQSVPTCIFHGNKDLVVPISQSNRLKAKLLANNVKVEMTAYALEGHGWYGKSLADTYLKTTQFLKENVQ